MTKLPYPLLTVSLLLVAGLSQACANDVRAEAVIRAANDATFNAMTSTESLSADGLPTDGRSADITAGRSLPPIDCDAPAVFATATFALG